MKRWGGRSCQGWGGCWGDSWTDDIFVMYIHIYTHIYTHSRKKALVAKMSEGNSSNSGSERIKDRAAAIAALKRRNKRGGDR